jgi:hypothetical protein
MSVALPFLLTDDVAELFANGIHAIARTRPNDSIFCIGDFPFVRYDDPRISDNGLAQEFWFVLSPTVAASFVLNANLPVDGLEIHLPNPYVRRLSYDLAMRSRYVVSKCPVALLGAIKGLGRYPEERQLRKTNVEDF